MTHFKRNKIRKTPLITARTIINITKNDKLSSITFFVFTRAETFFKNSDCILFGLSLHTEIIPKISTNTLQLRL